MMGVPSPFHPHVPIKQSDVMRENSEFLISGPKLKTETNSGPMYPTVVTQYVPVMTVISPLPPHMGNRGYCNYPTLPATPTPIMPTSTLPIHTHTPASLPLAALTPQPPPPLSVTGTLMGALPVTGALPSPLSGMPAILPGGPPAFALPGNFVSFIPQPPPMTRKELPSPATMWETMTRGFLGEIPSSTSISQQAQFAAMKRQVDSSESDCLPVPSYPTFSPVVINPYSSAFSPFSSSHPKLEVPDQQPLFFQQATEALFRIVSPLSQSYPTSTSPITSTPPTPAISVFSLDPDGSQSRLSSTVDVTNSVTSSLAALTQLPSTPSPTTPPQLPAPPSGDSPSSDGTSPESEKPISGRRVAAKKTYGYVCEFPGCGRALKTRFSLTRHSKKHAGTRPYACSYENCTRTFPEVNTLKRHLRVHTGERPFKCTVPGCRRAFADSSNYRRHMVTHSGEKPFKCPDPTCFGHRGFSRGSTLRKHLLSIHNVELSRSTRDACALTWANSHMKKRKKRKERPRPPAELLLELNNNHKEESIEGFTPIKTHGESGES